MRIWWNFFVALTIAVNPVLADEAQYLPKGTQAPFEGYLMTVPEAQKLRKLVIEGQTYQFQAESFQRSLEAQKKLTDISDSKTKLFSDDADKLSKQLQDARSTSDLTKFLYFGIGVAATVFAGWAVGQASK